MARSPAEEWKAVLASGGDVLSMMYICQFNYNDGGGRSLNNSLGEDLKNEISCAAFHKAADKLLAGLDDIYRKFELRRDLSAAEMQGWKFELAKQIHSPAEQLLSVIYGYHLVAWRQSREEGGKPREVYVVATATKVQRALDHLGWLMSVNRPVCLWLAEDQEVEVEVDLKENVLVVDSEMRVTKYGTEHQGRGGPGTVCIGWVLLEVDGVEVPSQGHAAALINRYRDSETPETSTATLKFATAKHFVDKLVTLICWSSFSRTFWSCSFRVGVEMKLQIFGQLCAVSSRMTEYVLSSWGSSLGALADMISLDELEGSSTIPESVAEVVSLLCLPRAPIDLKTGYQPQLECPICTKVCESSAKVWRCHTCKQPLHPACFAVWSQRNRVCPSCRSPYSVHDSTQDNLIWTLHESLRPFVAEKTTTGEDRDIGSRFLAGLAIANVADGADQEWVDSLRSAGFFEMLSGALEAATTQSDWPSGSRRYPQMWKLCLTIERLAGMWSCRADLTTTIKPLESWLEEVYKNSSACEETREFADRALAALDKVPPTPFRSFMDLTKQDPCLVPNWVYAADMLKKLPEDEQEDERRELAAFAYEVLEEHATAAAVLCDNRSFGAIEAMFRKHDQNKDGCLEKDEFSEFLKYLGVSTADIKRVFQSADLNSDGRISFTEFNKWIHSPVQESVRASIMKDSTGDSIQSLSVWLPHPSWDCLADVLTVTGHEEGADLAQKILASLCDWAEWIHTDAAMLQVLRWCSRFISSCPDHGPYQHLVQLYATKKGLPDGWDIEAMLSGVGSFFISKVAIEDVSPFQRLVDLTFRRQLGRDRRGKLPQRFVVEEVKELCHEVNWIAYTKYKKALAAREDTHTPIEWPWKKPRTSGHRTVQLNSYIDKTSTLERWGFELSGFAIASIQEGGSLWEHNTYRCDDAFHTIQVGDELIAVNGRTGIDAINELRRRCHGFFEVTIEVRSPASEAIPRLDEHINEWWFWHGAPIDAAKSIAAGHFQVSLAAKSGMYGAGIYFAESVTKSDEYTDRGGWRKDGDEEPLRCLLLCRVSLGRIHYNADPSPPRFELEQKVLNGAADALLGDRESCVGTHREFIVFNADAVYPNFAVFYRRSYD